MDEWYGVVGEKQMKMVNLFAMLMMMKKKSVENKLRL